MYDLWLIQKEHSEKFVSIDYLKFLSSLYYKNKKNYGDHNEAAISVNHFGNWNKIFNHGKR
jgi:hypothetical protein